MLQLWYADKIMPFFLPDGGKLTFTLPEPGIQGIVSLFELGCIQGSGNAQMALFFCLYARFAKTGREEMRKETHKYDKFYDISQ